MTLACQSLPDRSSPVALLFEWGDGADLLPWRSVVEATAVEVAARLTPPATTPAGLLTVYVGHADPGTLGQGLPLPGGMVLRLAPDADWGTYSLPTVVRHEVLHGVGVLGHGDNPDSLMWLHVQPHRDKGITPSDAKLAAGYGVAVAPPTFPPEGVTVTNPWGTTGWVRLTAEQAAGWWRAGNLH